MRRRSIVLTALMLALALSTAVIAGCGASTSQSSGPEKTATDGNKDGAVAVGVTAYPGTRPDEVYNGVYKMTTSDTFDQVVGFYKKELPQATFSEIKIDTGRGASFLVDSAEFHGNVSVEENLPSDGQVTITVSRIRTE